MTDDLGNTLYKRNKTYFPNVNTGAGNQMFPMAPGVAEGQARMAQIANTSTYKSRRTGGSMVASPQGGSMFVPFGQQQPYLDRAEVQGRLAAPQAYAQGFGQVSRPVLSDFSGYAPQQQQPLTPGQALGRFASYVAMPGQGTLSADIGRRIRSGAGAIGTFAANLYNRNNEMTNRGMSGQTSPQNYAFYNYNPSPAPMKPSRYFDF